VSSDGVGGVALVALVAIVPVIVLMLTSFVKVSVVLALLRNAIGSPDAPSGLVVMGVSLVLTVFVMAPVGVEMVRAAAVAPTDPAGTVRPGAPGGGGAAEGAGAPAVPSRGAAGERAAGEPAVRLDLEGAVRQLVPEKYRAELDAAERAIGPLRTFLAKHAAARDRETFVEVSRRMGRETAGDEIWVLAPAFLTTELREAFAIAVLIFIPFLVLDLVVGLALAALGLQATQPQVVALPLKLLLFVAVDGWRLLIDSLLRGYA
jgi:type III secretion protein R